MSKKISKNKPARFQKYKVKYKVEYEATISNIEQRFPKWKLLALGIMAIISLVVVLAVVLWPSNEATTARNGDTVKVAYNGSYDNGSVFDSGGINGSDPLQFTIGDSSMIPGFEKGVIGMSVNQTKNIRVKPEEGYGLKEYITDIALFPPNVAAGQYYSGSLANGLYVENARVTAVNESTVTLENLHPMAGMNLNFEITLFELIKAGQTATNTSG